MVLAPSKACLKVGLGLAVMFGDEGKEQGDAYEGPHKDRNMDVCGVLVC